MKGRINERFEVVFRSPRNFGYLIRVFSVLYFAMARDRSVSNPYLSTQPCELIKVSLYDLFITCYPIISIMVRRVVAASIQTRVFNRDAINVYRYCPMRNKIAKRFNYFGGWFRIRRVVGSCQAFPTSFTLPTISFRVPALCSLYVKTRTNKGQTNDLRRGVCMDNVK